MDREPSPMQPKVTYKTEVDEQTINVGRSTEVASKQETQKMLEQSLDTMRRDDPARSVYEKVWKGVKSL